MYNRFGNTPQYLCYKYPKCVADMSGAEIQALAQKQAKIDYPCCKAKALSAKLAFPVPFIPSARTRALGLACCKRKQR